jgi:hypothetical protein
MMQVMIRFTARQEERALPIILRQKPGMVLPGRTYLLAEDVIDLLRAEGIRFKELGRGVPSPGRSLNGERI